MHPKHVLLLNLSLVLAIALIFVEPVYSQEGLPIPVRVDYVSDYAQILDEQAEGELNRLLDRVKQEMGVEIYVLTILTLNTVGINEYGGQVSETWKLGEEDAKRKTLLFLVAVNDGQYRLVTNTGLEAVVPDEQLKKISETVIQPAFEREQYAQGIVGGINQILQLVAQGRAIQIPRSSGSGLVREDVLGILLGVALVVLVLGLAYLLSTLL